MKFIIYVDVPFIMALPLIWTLPSMVAQPVMMASPLTVALPMTVEPSYIQQPPLCDRLLNEETKPPTVPFGIRAFVLWLRMSLTATMRKSRTPSITTEPTELILYFIV